MATANALELGVDISGLDAVIVAGYRAASSFWQQAGRAGRQLPPVIHWWCWWRATTRSTPTWCTIPRRCSTKPVEATVTDPGNPYILGPHLLCAAASAADRKAMSMGGTPVPSSTTLTAQGALKRRRAGWYVGAGMNPHAQVNLRGGWYRRY